MTTSRSTSSNPAISEEICEAKDDEISEAKDEEISEAKDEEVETSRLQVCSSVPPATIRSKFPAVPAVSPAKRRRNEADVIASISEAKEEETEPTLPPEVQEMPLNEYHSNVEVREAEHPSDDDDVRPGAVRVAGINARQMSQRSFLHSDQDTSVGDANESVNDAAVLSSVVAEAVDEDRLFDELLFRRQSQGLVQAENVVTVDEEGEVDQKRISFAFTMRRTIAFAIVILAVITAVVVAVVLVSRPRKQSKQKTQAPSTAKLTASRQPTAAPVAFLETEFRSVLLHNNVSNIHDLNQSNTPQYQALNWLANIDKFLNASASAESIIDRYVLAVIYYANNGIQWFNEAEFLTFRSICAWHNGDSGAMCMTIYSGGLQGIVAPMPTPLDAPTVLPSFVPSSVTVPSVSRFAISNAQTFSPTSIVIAPSSSPNPGVSTLIKLTLGVNGLSGTIPTELGKLSSLVYLNLGNNTLTGAIPTELGGLLSLTSLDLAVNELTGTIPTEFGRLTNLTSLKLEANPLNGTIPTELGRLTSLTSLTLDFSYDVKGSIPTELGQLTGLTMLILVTTLSGTIPTELGRLTSLTDLVLDYNQLTGSIPTELGRLTGLTELYLDDNQINGTIPTELGRLSSLTKLYLDESQLSGTIPTELRGLTNLAYLNLANNNLHGTVPTLLAALENLEILFLYGNNFTGNLTATFCRRNWTNLEADCQTGDVQCSCCYCH